MSQRAAASSVYSWPRASGICGGGTGPSPVDPLAALVGWVENGVAPNALPAERRVSGVLQRARNLCPFPQVQVYQGGDINAASSFVCADSY